MIVTKVTTEDTFHPVEVRLTVETLKERDALLNVYRVNNVMPVDNVIVAASIDTLNDLVRLVQNAIK